MAKEPVHKPKIEPTRELADRELTDSELTVVVSGGGRVVSSDITIVKIVDRPSNIL
jgi:hypothetical protein